MSNIFSGNRSGFCDLDSGVFTSLAADLVADFRSLRDTLCALNYTALAAEVANVTGYADIQNVVSQAVDVSEAPSLPIWREISLRCSKINLIS